MLKVRNFLTSILVLFFVMVSFSSVGSFAQESSGSPMPPAEKATEAPKLPEGKCACAEPAVEALGKAYISLEEDEWPDAIKVCSDALNKVKELEKGCACPELPAYKDVATAYISYAQGGNILDGEEDIDCAKATKLYEGAISLLKTVTPKIQNEKIKREVNSVQEYCEEENEFVKDECQE